MCSNGNHVWIELSGMPLMNDDKQFSGYQGIGRDITKSKIIEEDNKRLLAIIEHIPEIIQMSDFHGNLLYLNKAGKNLLKIPMALTLLHILRLNCCPSRLEKNYQSQRCAIKEGMWQGLTKLRATREPIFPYHK
jgi:PAS domain-containing protein